MFKLQNVTEMNNMMIKYLLNDINRKSLEFIYTVYIGLITTKLTNLQAFTVLDFEAKCERFICSLNAKTFQ